MRRSNTGNVKKQSKPGSKRGSKKNPFRNRPPKVFSEDKSDPSDSDSNASGSRPSLLENFMDGKSNRPKNTGRSKKSKKPPK
jgi:hypothetical protein